MRNEEASQHSPTGLLQRPEASLAPDLLAPAPPEPLRRLSPWPLAAMIPGPCRLVKKRCSRRYGLVTRAGLGRAEPAGSALSAPRSQTPKWRTAGWQP